MQDLQRCGKIIQTDIGVGWFDKKQYILELFQLHTGTMIQVSSPALGISHLLLEHNVQHDAPNASNCT